MKFGAVPLDDALGAILAHSVKVPGGRLRKGLSLNQAQVDQLRDTGLTEVVVARPEPEDVDEDTAAARLADAILAGGQSGLRASIAATGRVNLFATVTGVVEVAPKIINAINAVDPMITVATVPEWQRMSEGGMVATVKIISYAVADQALRAAEAAASGALQMRPVTMTSATLIQTVVPGDDGARGHSAVFERLDRLGLGHGPKVVVPHTESALSTAISEADADLILILTGSATSDIADVAPASVIAAGGEVAHFGMPVDPGNLLFLGHIGASKVIGLPGCARSPALNGADWILERVVCGIPVGPSDITAMGVGGLLKDIPMRGRPRTGTSD